jgi:small-conductance mechanosensitive channel
MRPNMEILLNVLEHIKSILSIPLLKVANKEFTLWTLVYMGVTLFLLFYVSGKLRKFVVERLLVGRILDIGIRQAVATIFRYVVLVVGSVIILQTAGIDLTALNVLAGTVGIGVGFGLQNILSNFISGLIILFERPIKVGDRIDVGNVQGDVSKISGRSTTVVTNDNIAIIIPNSKFITENVINWSYTDSTVRIKVPLGVSYDSDVRLVEKLLIDVAAENTDVLEQPVPMVMFKEFGDSALLFELNVWTDTYTHRKNILISALNFAIIDKFRENGIEIPFPQRDIHFRSGEVRFEASKTKEGAQDTVE